MMARGPTVGKRSVSPSRMPNAVLCYDARTNKGKCLIYNICAEQDPMIVYDCESAA